MWHQSSIRTALMDSMVWPSRIVVPIIPGDYRYTIICPHWHLGNEFFVFPMLNVLGKRAFGMDMFFSPEAFNGCTWEALTLLFNKELACGRAASWNCIQWESWTYPWLRQRVSWTLISSASQILFVSCLFVKQRIKWNGVPARRILSTPSGMKVLSWR